jgi:hypothetical protein
MRIIVIAILVFSSISFYQAGFRSSKIKASAHSPAASATPPPCPSITSVTPSSATVKEKGKAVFVANTVNGPDLTWMWSVSSGEIISGQGTTSIAVKPAKNSAGGSITATVTIGGAAPSCGSDTASATVDIVQSPKPFLEVAAKSFMNSLNQVLTNSNNPGSRFIIVVYSKSDDDQSKANELLEKSVDKILSAGLNLSRFVILNGGGAENSKVEFYEELPGTNIEEDFPTMIQPPSIEGLVTGPGGTVVANGVVTVTKKNKHVATVKTMVNGKYKHVVPSQGEYKIKACSGKCSPIVTKKVDGNKVFTADLQIP